jgi:hypothetical protein
MVSKGPEDQSVAFSRQLQQQPQVQPGQFFLQDRDRCVLLVVTETVTP